MNVTLECIVRCGAKFEACLRASTSSVMCRKLGYLMRPGAVAHTQIIALRRVGHGVCFRDHHLQRLFWPENSLGTGRNQLQTYGFVKVSQTRCIIMNCGVFLQVLARNPDGLSMTCDLATTYPQKSTLQLRARWIQDMQVCL